MKRESNRGYSRQIFISAQANIVGCHRNGTNGGKPTMMASQHHYCLAQDVAIQTSALTEEISTAMDGAIPMAPYGRANDGYFSTAIVIDW